jgi:hypothetical protein
LTKSDSQVFETGTIHLTGGISTLSGKPDISPVAAKRVIPFLNGSDVSIAASMAP